MKKFLLPENGEFYKANLHCHTDISDGQFSPEEIKQMYMEQGYSIVAFTDHEIMVPHNDLAEPGFLPLNGYEYEVNEPLDPVNPIERRRKKCHICMVALEPEGIHQVCWGENIWGNVGKHLDEALIDRTAPLYRQRYGGEGVSEVMQMARNAGFFVTYNHPQWSLEDMTDIAGYHGMHALEIFNSGSVHEGWDDYNPAIYDAMLRRGNQIYCIAADDNHGIQERFGGWTMIRADKLEYRTIAKALEDGHFYASTGPQIHALWFEDGNIHIECSPAAVIKINAGVRMAGVKRMIDEPLTSATFPISGDEIYIRLTVIDQNGGHANTNAYFTDKLFSE